VGETGGLLAFSFLIAMISSSFAKLGHARRALRGDTEKEWYQWFLGAVLFSHVVAFFGVNYFDQMRYAWFLILIMIQVATAPILRAQAAGAVQDDPIADQVLARNFSRIPVPVRVGGPVHGRFASSK
jgi:hypothetical protein